MLFNSRSLSLRLVSPMYYLRAFAPIATAHVFALVTHTSCIADHEGKHDAKGVNLFTRMERESGWHRGIAVDPGLLETVTQ